MGKLRVFQINLSDGNAVYYASQIISGNLEVVLDDTMKFSGKYCYMLFLAVRVQAIIYPLAKTLCIVIRGEYSAIICRKNPDFKHYVFV